MMAIEMAANIIGMTGTSLVVGAYFLLQTGKLNSESLSFNLINLVGAFFLALSLLVHFNLASMVIEVFWILASLVGLWRYRQRRKQARDHH